MYACEQRLCGYFLNYMCGSDRFSPESAKVITHLDGFSYIVLMDFDKVVNRNEHSLRNKCITLRKSKKRYAFY